MAARARASADSPSMAAGPPPRPRLCLLKEKYGFYFSTVQIELSDGGEEGAEEIEFLRHEKFNP